MSLPINHLNDHYNEIILLYDTSYFYKILCDSIKFSNLNILDMKITIKKIGYFYLFKDFSSNQVVQSSFDIWAYEKRNDPLNLEIFKV